MSTFANVYVGATANDGTGDPLRSAFIKIDQNFANIPTIISTGVSSVAGRTGNVVLTINDVYGAVSYANVKAATDAANAYVNTVASSIGSTNVAVLNTQLNTLDANVGFISYEMTSLTSNAVSQALSLNTLTANIIALTANAATQENEIGNLSTRITTLTANAATQEIEISSLRSNIAAITTFPSKFSSNLVLTSGQTSDGVNNVGALVVTNGGGIYVDGNVRVYNELFVGAEPVVNNIDNTIGTFRGTSGAGPGNQYTQVAIINSTNDGSADLALYADNGNDDGGWIDMGYTGSQFNDPAYSITRPGDGYVISQAVSSSYGGNLVITTGANGSYNDIVFGLAGFNDVNEVGRMHRNNDSSVNFNFAGNIQLHNILFNTSTSKINFTNLLQIREAQGQIFSFSPTGFQSYSNIATTTDLVASGNIYAAGGHIRTTAPIANIFNSTSTIYMGLVANVINVGSAYSTTNVNGNLSVANLITANNLTAGNNVTAGNYLFANGVNLITTVNGFINTVNTNINAFETYANANLSSMTTTLAYFIANAATQETEISNLVANISTINSNVSTIISNVTSNVSTLTSNVNLLLANAITQATQINW